MEESGYLIIQLVACGLAAYTCQQEYNDAIWETLWWWVFHF